MSRLSTVSNTFLDAISRSATDEVFLTLLTFSSSEIATVRLVQNTEDITSNGNVFQACPFQIDMPSDARDGAQRSKLQIDNVDRAIVQALRSVSKPVSVDIEVILASDPDTIEIAFPAFKLTRVEWDALIITGDLTHEPFLRAAYPKDTFGPANFPGLFA